MKRDDAFGHQMAGRGRGDHAQKLRAPIWERIADLKLALDDLRIFNGAVLR